MLPLAKVATLIGVLACFVQLEAAAAFSFRGRSIIPKKRNANTLPHRAALKREWNPRRPSARPSDIFQILREHEEEFFSSFLHIVPAKTTTTVTKTSTETTPVTATATTTTTTVSTSTLTFGTTTVSTSDSTTTSTTVTGTVTGAC